MLQETGLVKQQTIEDFCNKRNDIIKRYEEILGKKKELKTLTESIYAYILPWNSIKTIPLEDFIQKIDQFFWRHTFTQAGLMQFMDTKASKDFFETLEEITPEFKEDNIEGTLLNMQQMAQPMFNRGLVEIFMDLSGRHKTNTNKPFGINKKAILSNMVMGGFNCMRVSYSQYSKAEGRLNDMDRVFKILDRKEFKERELEGKVNEALKDSTLYEDKYYKIRCFKNGNMHITFKREDLLKKSNLIIAEWFGDKTLK